MNQELLQNGFLELNFPYSEELRSLVLNEEYLKLDALFLKELLPSGRFYDFFTSFFKVEHIEHIIAIRTAPEDEDGIWHDDGSRQFGFSLSLNLNPKLISGGHLEFKLKNSESIMSFSPRPFGVVIIFLTGQFGFEHKVSQVTSGKRTVIAGWGSTKDAMRDFK